MNRKSGLPSFLIFCALVFAIQLKAQPVKSKAVEKWVTTANQHLLLKKEAIVLNFSDRKNALPAITIDDSKTYQEIDGFGFTLTGGSAMLINTLPAATKAGLLQELFGKSVGSIGISYLRLSMGASDLDASVFSYDDLPAGQADEALARFSLSNDTAHLVPVLKEILRINPKIKIIATPWSAPVWMKDNGKTMGGHLSPKYFETYAQYFVKYIKTMQAIGITIDAITPQNEPLHDGNNPSMVMTPGEQGKFVGKFLGPAFRNAGITTKIVLYDHNCDKPEYPLTILKDSVARQYVDGSAFHLYGGEISALSKVHDQFPEKNVYFTEQWVGSKSKFNEELSWHTSNVIIGSMRNWSRVALEWNLANDPGYGPHTDGGCTECKGALTIGKTITRNVAYYIIGHASKFIPAGSHRIESNSIEKLPNVAFVTPAGRKVLIVLNEGKQNMFFNIKDGSGMVATSLPPGAVGTFTW